MRRPPGPVHGRTPASRPGLEPREPDWPVSRSCAPPSGIQFLPQEPDGPAPGICVRVGGVAGGPRCIEPMLYARVDVHLDIGTLPVQPIEQAMGEGDGDVAVGLAVENQEGWKGGNSL